eukprot:244099_1
MIMSLLFVVLTIFVLVHSKPNSHFDPEGRILNGQVADISDYPWLVSFQWTQDGTDVRNVACTASLIRSEYPAAILTAAHCCNAGVLTTNTDGYKYYGDIGRQYPHTLEDNDTFISLRAFFFWNYGGSQQRGNEVNALTDYDACVVLLDGEVTDVTPVQLYNPNDNTMTSQCCTDNQTVTAIGYGFTDDQQTETDSLRYVDTQYMSNIQSCSQELLQCLTDYKDNTINWQDIVPSDGSTVCTTRSGVAICQGDSGGPLIYTDDNGDVVQIGIASQSCCIVGVPNMYANVGTFYESIQGLLADETAWISYVPSKSPTTNPPNTNPTGNVPSVSPTQDKSSDGEILKHYKMTVILSCAALFYHM